MSPVRVRVVWTLDPGDHGIAIDRDKAGREICNYARPGREAVHNGAYWRGVPYLGLGNGSHSYVGGTRWWNERDWTAYRTAVAAGTSPRADEERVSGESGRLERLWLGLRTREGVAWSDLDAGQRDVARSWVAQGRAEAVAGRLRLTLEGWLLLDALVVELDAAVGVA